MMNSRGLADVVATITLVLLTVVAVSILATFVFKFINDQKDKTTCFNYKDYFQFTDEFEFNCYKTVGTNHMYAFSVAVNGDKNEELIKNIVGFDVSFSKEAESKSVSVLNGTPQVSDSSGVRKINSVADTPASGNLEIPGPGESRTYVYNAGTNQYGTIRIYPRIKDRLCGAEQPVIIQHIGECDSPKGSYIPNPSDPIP